MRVCDVFEAHTEFFINFSVQGVYYLQHKMYDLVFKVEGDTKKRELLKTPTKIEETQKKKKLLTEIEPLQLAF